MNKERRNEIKLQIKNLEIIKSKINTIKNIEENNYDNIPDNLQNSIRAIEMEDCIDSLEDAIISLEKCIESLEEV